MIPASSRGDDIYPHWRHDDLKYYWKDYENRVVERDLSFGDKARVEVIELAREGNEQAIYALTRGAKNSPDTVTPEVWAVLDELGVKV